MRALGASRRSEELQLVDRREDDPRRSIELRFEDLKHRDPVWAYLKHTTPGSSRRIVCGLGQFDEVKGDDFMSYCHGSPMLEVRIGSDQSWRTVFVGVMQRQRYLSASAVHCQPDVNTAGDAEGRPIMNNFDWHRDCLFNHGFPHEGPIAYANVKDGAPLRSVALYTEYPTLHLLPLVPGVLGSRKSFTCSRWPSHRSDAMEWRRACASLKSRLRAIDHAKGARA